MSAIRIDIACNDPDNGVFAGRAHQIQLPDDLGELMALAFYENRSPRFVETAAGFRLAGKAWPVIRSKEYVGNWCWNAYWLDVKVAARFLAWLHGRRLFSFDTGETRLFNRWRIERRFSDSDIAFVERLLFKAALHERAA